MRLRGYSVFAKFYDAYIRQDFPELHDKYLQLIMLTCKKFALTSKSILDLGCGTGILLSKLSKRGYDCEGVDDSTLMLRHAKKKGLVVHHADITSYSLKKYDLIVCFDTLGHLTTYRKLRKFFTCARRHLQEGGLLLFDIGSKKKADDLIGKTFTHHVNDYSLVWRNSRSRSKVLVEMEIGKGKRKWIEQHEVRGYSQEELSRLIKQAGMRILLQTEEPLVKPRGSLIYCCQK